MTAFSAKFRGIIFILFILSLPHERGYAQLLPHSHYKYQVILTVFEKIAAANGDVRKIPALEVNSQKSNQHVIAQFRPHPQPKIIVDEQLYDICTQFGPDSLNALACIVGHELAHYYENHIWGNSFADMIGLAQEEKTEISKSQKSTLEAEADYFGLFYGFLAGYETFRLLPEALNTIYQQYELPEQLKGYPSKQERLSIAEEKVSELTPLIYAFRAGQLLYLRKNYEEAAVCFDYILSKYPGREVYNSAGVVKLAQALKLMDAEEVYFAYPFEFDANTRLQRGTARASGDNTEKQQKIDDLLSQAQAYFDKAITMDKAYMPGYVNLACTYSLQNNQAAAIGKINELEKICKAAKEDLPGNAHLIRGIALVKNEQISKASSDFEQAVEQEAYQADYNQALYKKINNTWDEQITDWITQWPVLEKWVKDFWHQESEESKLKPEKIPVSTAAYSEETTNVAPVTLMITDPEFPVKITVTEADKAYHLKLELSDYILLASFTASNYAGETSLGISIGADLSEVKEKYGEPSHSTAGTGNLRYDYYESARTIFASESNKVKGWWIYKITY